MLSPPYRVSMGKAKGACLAVCRHVNITDHRGAESQPILPQSHTHKLPDLFWATSVVQASGGIGGDGDPQWDSFFMLPGQGSISEGPGTGAHDAEPDNTSLEGNPTGSRGVWREGDKACTSWTQDLESERYSE